MTIIMSMSEMLEETNARRIASNKENLAHAVLSIDSDIAEMQRHIEGLTALRNKIVDEGDVVAMDDIATKRLYDAARKA